MSRHTNSRQRQNRIAREQRANAERPLPAMTPEQLKALEDQWHDKLKRMGLGAVAGRTTPKL